MRVYVQDGDKEYLINVELSDTIEVVKKKILEHLKYNIIWNESIVLYRGVALVDEKTVESYKIRENTCITLLLEVNGLRANQIFNGWRRKFDSSA